MAKTMKTTSLKTKNDMKFSINIDIMKGRKFTTSEIGRGIGVHKSKKTYTRKPKYKGQADY